MHSASTESPTAIKTLLCKNGEEGVEKDEDEEDEEEDEEDSFAAVVSCMWGELPAGSSPLDAFGECGHLRACTGVAMTVKKKVVPFPRSLSNHVRPP